MTEQQVLQVIKHPHEDGRPVQYTGRQIESPPDWIAVRATWTHGTYDLDYLRFQNGDYLDEYFALERPYNAFALYREDSTFVGWYCNVTHPTEVNGGEIHWYDLYVDVVVYPDGSTLVLDEDELEASGLARRDPNLYALILEGRDELLRLAAENAFPFCTAPVQSP